MTTGMLVWVVILCGAGTFLARLLPMSWRRAEIKGASARRFLRNALDAVGPAAIVALLVSSFSPLIAPASWGDDIIPVAAGLIGVLVGRKLSGSIAGATLAGVAAYGVALWLATA